MTIMVTGGAGFIGSNFVKYVAEKQKEPVVVIDSLTYAGDLANLNGIDGTVYFTECNIANDDLVLELLRTYHPRGIINFAAESHVDRSIGDPLEFVYTNVVGTVKLLEAVRKYLNTKHQYRKDHSGFRFHHVSTDEVYGSLSITDPEFKETTPYNPQSPYAASKAASDHFVVAYGNTYKIPYVITNCSNNYGPHQHPEKLIPTVILNALKNNPIPMYGTGSNVRDWIHVEDHCEILYRIFVDGKNGSKYNIGGDCEISNRMLIHQILSMMGKPSSLVQRVPDRLGHDFRYGIDSTKIKKEFKWKPRIDLITGLQQTINWYTKKYE